ncbi:MAG: gamma-glutamyl-gamma-aminobutyrate hydrolase family protein [Alphaproteobacteria bacterium]
MGPQRGRGKMTKPLIGVTACVRQVGHHDFNIAGEKYLTALIEACGAIPMIVPALADKYDVDDLLQRLDGLLLTGSPSNVDAVLYGAPYTRDDEIRDPRRDHTNLTLIRHAVQQGVPVFGICRGIQELNVALGGTLHQNLSTMENRQMHFTGEETPLEEMYAPMHEVDLIDGGVLAGLTGQSRILINSIHTQGVDKLGEGLQVEAVADDGQIEAVSAPDAAALTLGVQWHPEWQWWKDENSTAMFRAFGDATRLRAETR